MIIILVGKSGSGKSTIMRHCVEQLKLSIPKWFVTREPRNDISDDVYTFLSPREFLDKQLTNEIENANVLYGNLYGSNFPDYKHTNYISIMDVEGMWKAKRKYGKHVIGVFIECPEHVRAYRMLMRGDSTEDVTYRLGTDRTMFKGAFDVTDYKITSQTPRDDIRELIDIIRDIEEENGVELIEKI
jgi:guanylate kinase